MTSFSFLEINLRIIMYLTKCKTFIPCDSKIIKLYWVLWSDISSWYTITKCNCILFYSNCLWIFHEFLGFKNYQWWSENENLSHKGVSHVPFCPPSTVKGKKGQDKRGQNRHKILKMAKMIKISWKRDKKGQKRTKRDIEYQKIWENIVKLWKLSCPICPSLSLFSEILKREILKSFIMIQSSLGLKSSFKLLK